ncbi:MAG TPA: hypothetical protein ENG73_11415 [Desulfobacterales bacterium]|nr:hypothetical protein [Desulfobacterales bacterium]
MRTDLRDNPLLLLTKEVLEGRRSLEDALEEAGSEEFVKRFEEEQCKEVRAFARYLSDKNSAAAEVFWRLAVAWSEAAGLGRKKR